MIQNLHTHTPRCHHARGSEEEYVNAAIAAGLQILGFSDHSPYVFDGDHRSTVRMGMDELPGYAQTVRALGRQYAHQIRIHLGVEAEYYPAFFQETRLRLADQGVEYMILGQHWLDNEIGAHRTTVPTEDEALLKKYCHQVLDAMQSGYFTYLCHPDVMNYVGDPKVYQVHMRQLCREAKACDIPLEYNLWGIDQKKFYPRRAFWELAAEENCPVVLGIDAHRPEVLNDPVLIGQAMDTVRELGLELLASCPLRNIE